MASNFAQELQRASEALAKFTEHLGKAGGGGSGGPVHELARFGSGSMSAAGNAGGAAAGIMGGGLAAAGPAGMALAAGQAAFGAAESMARFLTPAARAFAATGTAQGFSTGITQSLIGAAESTAIGGVIMAASGMSQANDTAKSAGGRVKNITENLARAGIEVPKEFRQNLINTALKQEKAASTEAAKVDAITGSAETLNKVKPEGAGAGFDAILGILMKIASLIENFPTGGKR